MKDGMHRWKREEAEDRYGGLRSQPKTVRAKLTVCTVDEQRSRFIDLLYQKNLLTSFQRSKIPTMRNFVRK